MAEYEFWADAYLRIKREVEAEMPEVSVAEQFAEYRTRCQAWKRERGIR